MHKGDTETHREILIKQKMFRVVTTFSVYLCASSVHLCGTQKIPYEGKQSRLA
jgi:hypothetical protein